MMNPSVAEIWEMINSLTPEEKNIIYKKIQEDIRYKMSELLDKVNERAENDAITMEEITKEVEEVRGNNHAKN